MSAVLALVGLGVAFGAFGAVDRLQDALDRPDDGLEPHVWKWLAPAIVAAYVLLVEGRTLASIGWGVGGVEAFGFHVAVGLAVMLGANAVFAPIQERLGLDAEIAAGFADFTDLSTAGRLFVAGTAGVTEEVPYRGYAIERGAALTGSPLLAAAVSTVAFLYAHVGDTWTAGAAVQMLLPTVVLVWLYLWTHSLPVVMAVHALNDAVGLLMAERMVESTDSAPA